MNIVIFDTETTSLEKPFCYNIGYRIVNLEDNSTIIDRSYVVEQVWHNPMLFTTAYYSDKRESYVADMRCRKTLMRKFGTICQQMIHDFAKYDVIGAYAYNSSFDERVFNFNCDWFRCNNPFDEIPIFDIRGYAIRYLVDDNYKAFCEEHNLFTESKNYSTTAEAVYKYVSQDTEFIEDHTALEDSIIEWFILAECFYRGAEVNTDIKAPKSVERLQTKKFTVKVGNEVVFEKDVNKITYYKSKNTVKLI